MWLRSCAMAVALANLVVAQLPEPEKPRSFSLGGLKLTMDDIENQEIITTWATKVFYSHLRHSPEHWSHIGNDLSTMAHASADYPSIALGVGMALYSYFWWTDTTSTRVNVDSGRKIVDLFHRSITYNTCSSIELPLQDFYVRQCHVRWRYLLMVVSEVGRYCMLQLQDLVQAAFFLRQATTFLNRLKQLPFFQRYEQAAAIMHSLALQAPPESALARFGAGLRGIHRTPHDVNFNQDFYPHLQVGPIWPKEEVPLAAFLEEHFEDFLADLRHILDDSTFWSLHFQNQNAETQFGPRDDDWQTVYLVRNREWNQLNCGYTPTACRLLQQRPEIANCAWGSAGAGYLRLRPGARLKPHFGNAPRLSAHLGLIVPEEGDIHMRVGDQTVHWETGKAVIFDDTYIHSVVHDGLHPRFVLLVWFCHPCDLEHLVNATHEAPDFCTSPF